MSTARKTVRTFSALAAVLAAGFATSLVAGCAQNGGESLLILHDSLPALGCVLSAQDSDTFTTSGVIDISSSQGYVFTPLIENVVLAANDVNHPVDPSYRIATVSGAEVELTFPNASLFTTDELTQLNDAGLLKFTAPFSMTIPPDDGLGVASFEIVPAQLIQAIGMKAITATQPQLVIAKITAIGNIADSNVQSQAFSFPITVCNGCQEVDNGLCSSFSGTATRVGGPCNPKQDGAVDCCEPTPGATTLTCPASNSGS